ncbi:MAG: BMP family ABC transporter substrate-binding protein [Clostridia bacterium]|nr:BMP family ABC transporter substrate-binding protein [Clostridia bacterium]
MKKILALLLAVVMVFALAACGGNNNDEAKDDFKVGFIFLHDENSTYDKNFMDAAAAVQKELGLTDEQVLYKSNIPESNECYEAALELVDAGCDVIFGDSFGFESHLLKAAKEHPEVQFCHATGTNAKTAGLANYHNAFASIYEGRYLAGIAAGMKLNEMIKEGKFTAEEAKMGYVGAFPYAEVISGFSSFYLGAKSVCPTVTMEVKYTNSWFDIAAEKEAAQALIQSGCKLISQHADSEGAPKACEEKGIPNIAYNINTSSIGPNTAIISSKISWEPYMKLMIESVMNGKEIPVDYTGTLATGSVQLTELNEKVAAEGTQAALDAAAEKLKNGEIHVFDTSTFTVGGKTLDENTLADVIPDANYEADTKVVSDGYYHESEYRSAPYFFVVIDGITGVIPE